MKNLKAIIDAYMRKVSGIEEYCGRCLRTERWNGRVVLMIVDAAFTSIGLNYFTAVVPKVQEFNARFVETGVIRGLKDLAEADMNMLMSVWKNRRSWRVAKEVSLRLSTISDDDKTALRNWARNARLEDWKNDLIGSIKGVGLSTFQYLRMMGGVDTVMPDKIVRRVINDILRRAGYEPVNDGIKFVKKAEEIALQCGYRPIELCWMTWLIQTEGGIPRVKKYSSLLPKI
ncbi:hypothetical protein J7L06_03990 [Candidatus Bathyarchaeota archaeon]|nr:hypothetical protein [Candidatus Bathyarchaeota archaeon]